MIEGGETLDRNDSAFAERLKYLMQQRGLSQYQLAHLSGLSESTISKYINSDTKPNFNSILALAEALMVSPKDLFDLVKK